MPFSSLREWGYSSQIDNLLVQFPVTECICLIFNLNPSLNCESVAWYKKQQNGNWYQEKTND